MTDHDEASGRPDVTSLQEVAGELMDQAREHHSRRAARTLVSGSSMRATVIALAEGAALAEHDAPPAATLQVLVGSVRLHADTDEWVLTAGEVVPIPPARHGLEARSDSAVLLTVALH